MFQKHTLISRLKHVMQTFRGCQGSQMAEQANMRCMDGMHYM